MKKLALGLTLVLAAGSLFAQNRSVDFQHATFAEVKAKAKAANKPIFFDGFTTWCGPCKYMANTVFTQDKVADFFNDKFINTKFDMEKGEGVELAKKFEVKAFPTFLILDTAGNVIHRIVGGAEADEFIEKVKVGLNPETSLAGQKAKYNNGNRDAKFILGYLKTLQDAYMQQESETIAQGYLKSLKENERVTKDNWVVYNDFVNDLFSKDFIFILTNRLKFTEVAGDSAVTAKIGSVFSSKAMSLLVNRRGTVYSKEESKKVRDFIGTCGVKDSQTYLALLDMADAKAAKNGTAIAALAEKAVKNTNISDRDSYNILSQAVPVVTDYGTKSDFQLLSNAIDARILTLKEEKAKPYFEQFKKQLTDKMNEVKK